MLFDCVFEKSYFGLFALALLLNQLLKSASLCFEFLGAVFVTNDLLETVSQLSPQLGPFFQQIFVGASQAVDFALEQFHCVVQLSVLFLSFGEV